jgi:hydroxyethylthiazole kinase
MGCALSALCAAFLAVDHDFFAAALHALWLANAAAERAAAQGAGPGTFVPAWLDAVARLTENPGEAWMDRREGEEE